MPVLNPTKTISSKTIDCDGITNVSLSFSASAELVQNPADIVLVMDRSSSMNSTRIKFAKEAANKFIEMVSSASGSTDLKLIENGSRIGIVSFGTDATEDSPLTNDVEALKGEINGLVRGGYTNQKAAFELAKTLYDTASSNRKIMIMFTDGEYNQGGNPDSEAEAIKASGVEIFCIGLAVDPTDLNKWASDPDSTHVVYTDDPIQLERIFKETAQEVILAGAMDILIKEELEPDFKIVKILDPAEGTVSVTSPQTLEWSIKAAGVSAQETTTSLSFDIMYVGTDGGVKNVNKSISYKDRAGTVLNFPDISVEVKCAGPIISPEPCPVPTSFTVDGCKDSTIVNLMDVSIQSLGRIVQVDAVIENVCPDKRVAAAIILTEEGPNGEEYSRGMKTILIPAQGGTECQSIELKCIHFVVPEELDASGDKNSICNDRKFKARVFANYVDTDFVCCDSQTVTI